MTLPVTDGENEYLMSVHVDDEGVVTVDFTDQHGDWLDGFQLTPTEAEVLAKYLATGGRAFAN